MLYSSNTTSITIVKNLTALSSTTDKINSMSNQRTSKLNINSLKINVNGIVLVFYEKIPTHFWRIVIATRVLPSRDSKIRGAVVRIAKTNTILKRSVNKLLAVENTYHDT